MHRLNYSYLVLLFCVFLMQICWSSAGPLSRKGRVCEGCIALCGVALTDYLANWCSLSRYIRSADTAHQGQRNTSSKKKNRKHRRETGTSNLKPKLSPIHCCEHGCRPSEYDQFCARR
uniref:Insulin-like domain-containing protein n=1 Tax=Romanomermis culicivorax TaxID=13658 RepID=A0A915L8M0_ROMCU